jgi:hypothetical protein
MYSEKERPAAGGATGLLEMSDQAIDTPEDSKIGTDGQGGSNRLPVLAVAIKDAHKEAVAALQTSSERALAAGEMLVEAKGLVGHGRWRSWLKSLGISERSAQRYMMLHRAGLKPAIVTDLGVASAEKYASIGLSLMPTKDHAICATGSDVDRDILSGCVAYWWQEAGGVRFFSCAMFGEQAWYHLPAYTLPIWLIGCIEGDRARAYDCWATEEVPIADATTWLRQFEAKGPSA